MKTLTCTISSNIVLCYDNYLVFSKIVFENHLVVCIEHVNTSLLLHNLYFKTVPSLFQELASQLEKTVMLLFCRYTPLVS